MTQNSIFSIEILNKTARYFICGYSISNILIFCRTTRTVPQKAGIEAMDIQGNRCNGRANPSMNANSKFRGGFLWKPKKQSPRACQMP